jgi:hypothetical protein
VNAVPPEVQVILEKISAYQIFIWIGLALVLIFWLRKAWPIVKKAVATIDALDTLPDDMAHVKQEIETVKHELFPNSGKSLRDKVDQIATMGIHTDTKVTAAIAWQEEHKVEADAAFEKIDILWNGREEKNG